MVRLAKRVLTPRSSIDRRLRCALPTHNGKGQTKGLVVRYLRLFAVWMVLAIVGGALRNRQPSPPDVGVSEAGPNVDASEPAADTGVVTPLPDAGAALDAGLVVEAARRATPAPRSMPAHKMAAAMGLTLAGRRRSYRARSLTCSRGEELTEHRGVRS